MPNDRTEEHRALLREFARLFYTERQVRTAFTRYVAEDYVQHNPNIADGREAAIDALADMFVSPDRSFEILAIIVDGDDAVIHVRASREGAPQTSVMDRYRLADGRIVEHWDVLQPVPEHARNPHPMF